MNKKNTNLKIQGPVTLKTDRLTLRPYTLEDAKQAFQIATKYPDMTRYMCWNPPEKIEETIDSYHRGLKSTDEHYSFSIEFDGQFVGRITLKNFLRKIGAADLSLAELGFWISPEFQRKGFMKEAVDQVVQFGFKKLGLRRIHGDTFFVNKASRKLFEKCGFREVGVIEDCIFKNGKTYDECLYEVVNKNWKPNDQE